MKCDVACGVLSGLLRCQSAVVLITTAGLPSHLHQTGDTRILTPLPPRITRQPPTTKITLPTCARYYYTYYYYYYYFYYY